MCTGQKTVSVLFNEPKLLKSGEEKEKRPSCSLVSVLFNEPKLLKFVTAVPRNSNTGGFSALQRAEIAEIASVGRDDGVSQRVSVLFNEPKLLKSRRGDRPASGVVKFQCSSTSRNC